MATDSRPIYSKVLKCRYMQHGAFNFKTGKKQETPMTKWGKGYPVTKKKRKERERERELNGK